jgi:hypothetical protein
VERLRKAARQVGAACLLLPAACSAPREDGDPWSSTDPLTEREQAIGWLDGEPVTYGDLSRFLRARDALSFSRTLDGLIVDRITRTEADNQRVNVPVALVERRTRTRYVAFEARLREATRERTGTEVDPRVWLNRTLGLTPEQFQVYLRGQIEVELLQDRLIRYAEFRERSVEVSLIVVEDAKTATEARRRLEAGEPFAVVAKALSKHATAPAGGRIDHRMIAPDFEDEATAKAVLRASAGQTAGPFETEGDGRAFFRIYRVEKVQDGRRVPYAELAPEIEKDLQKRPVSVGEYVHWRRRMQETHGFLTSVGGDSTR